jgi:integrase
MPRKGKRVRLDTGIYRDASGVSVRVGTQERRFGLGTPLILLQQVRVGMLEIHARTKTTGRATLRRDCARYMKRKQHLQMLRSVQAELDAWCDLYGSKPRHAITKDDVLDARTAWLEEGKAPKTVNHRLNRLRALFRELDGPQAWSPTDHIKPLSVPRTPIQRITPQLVLTVLDNMATSRNFKGRLMKTAARFMVYATTGRRPSEIARAEKNDVDFEHRIWQPRDGKGGFTPGIVLNDDMLAAWMAFDAADCWGTFNTRLMARTLKRYGWPNNVRVYNLRHTIGIDLREAGFDAIDVGPGMFGHKGTKMVERHYAPVRFTALQRMSEFLAGRFGFPVPQNRSTNAPESGSDTPRNEQNTEAAIRGKKPR